MPSPTSPLQFDYEVPHDGRLNLQLPFPVGTHVSVFVTDQPAEKFDDLQAAAESSLDFWNNPLDDED